MTKDMGLNFRHLLQQFVDGTVFVFFGLSFLCLFLRRLLTNLGINDNQESNLILTPSGRYPVSTLEFSEVVCDQTLRRSGALCPRNVKDLLAGIHGAQLKPSATL